MFTYGYFFALAYPIVEHARSLSSFVVFTFEVDFPVAVRTDDIAFEFHSRLAFCNKFIQRNA